MWPTSKQMKLDISNLVCSLIVMSTAKCMLKFHSMGVFRVTWPLKIWGEMGNSVSETVQERDSYNGWLIGNHMCPVDWYQYQWPWMTLKVIRLLHSFSNGVLPFWSTVVDKFSTKTHNVLVRSLCGSWAFCIFCKKSCDNFHLIFLVCLLNNENKCIL